MVFVSQHLTIGGKQVRIVFDDQHRRLPLSFQQVGQRRLLHLGCVNGESLVLAEQHGIVLRSALFGGFFRRYRQGNRECGAVVFGAAHRNLSREQPDEGLRQGQADAGTAVLVPFMIETFEQHLDLLRRDIGTAVEHPHAPHALSTVLEAMERDVDPSPFRREFERIGQEIDVDFLHFVPVEGNEIIGHVRPEVELDALLVQDALEHLVDFHEEDVQPLQRVAGLHLAVFVLAEIEYLGDQV